jgi:hypothetical protein
MISKGSLVRTKTHLPNMPPGTVCLVVTGSYMHRDKTLASPLIDILFEGNPRMIDVHNVEEVQ